MFELHPLMYNDHHGCNAGYYNYYIFLILKKTCCLGKLTTCIHFCPIYSMCNEQIHYQINGWWDFHKLGIILKG